jgi:phage terminase large subunit-like protein
MSHAADTNFEFWLEGLVRTNRTSCIMLKVMEEPKLNPYRVICSLR